MAENEEKRQEKLSHAEQLAKALQSLKGKPLPSDFDELENGGFKDIFKKSRRRSKNATVGGVVFINNNSTVAPMDVAGHEAFHVWKGSAAREAYVQTVLDSLNFASEAFFEYQQKIVDAYFDGEIDLVI